MTKKIKIKYIIYILFISIAFVVLWYISNKKGIGKKFNTIVFNIENKNYSIRYEELLTNKFNIYTNKLIKGFVDNKKQIELKNKVLEVDFVERVNLDRNGDNLVVNFKVRTPILKVFVGKESFLIDYYKKVYKNHGLEEDIIVVSGNLKKTYLNDNTWKEKLLNLINKINKDQFLKHQIVQVYYKDKNQVFLTPLVGYNKINFGKIYNIDGKLSKLKKFYSLGSKKLNLNNYEIIDLRFKNQVVCKKL